MILSALLIKSLSKEPKVTTLAIGDGANDVNMITAAHVGIGIKGKSRARRPPGASDYALGEFKFLKPSAALPRPRGLPPQLHPHLLQLLQEHAAGACPQFWYFFRAQILSIRLFNFSGQTLYDSYLYQLFNLFYASMPIVIYAVFDEEYSSDFLDKAPQAYQQGMQGKFSF